MFRRRDSAAGTLTFDAIAQHRTWVLESCAKAGFNLAGVIAPAEYDAIAPRALKSAQMLKGCVAVVAIGNAGGEMWTQMAAYSQARSGYIDAEDNPIDWYTRARLGEVRRGLRDRGAQLRVLYASDDAVGALPLRRVGELAGFGRVSHMGLLLHPEFGMNVALRALFFVNLAFEATSRDEAFDPCGPCDKPCMGACPGSAVPEAGYHLETCAAFRRGGGCVDQCDARQACPFGRDHALSEAQIHYHHRRSGRMLRG